MERVDNAVDLRIVDLDYFAERFGIDDRLRAVLGHFKAVKRV